MRSALVLLLLATQLGAQTAPVGDVYQSGSPSGTAESPQAAYRKLYQLTAQIVQFPAAGYQPPKVDDWPEITAAQKNWYDAMVLQGGRLSANQRDRLVPGAEHLMNAINDMERGYRIQITAKNWMAQQTVKKLYARAQDEFALCNQNGVKAPEPNSTDASSQPASANAANPNADTLKPSDIDTAKIYKLQLEIKDSGVLPIPVSPQPMDTVGDHLLAGVLDWASSTLNMLAEEPGRPVNDAGAAIGRYFTRNSNDNHEALRAAAEKGVQQFEEDPARAVGQLAPNFIPLPKIKALQQLAGVEKTAEEAIEIAQTEKQFAKGWDPGAMTVEPPPVSSGFAENACFDTAIAQDTLWRSGENYKIAGVQVTNGRANLLASRTEIRQQLASRYRFSGWQSKAFNQEELDTLSVGQPIPSSGAQIGSYLRGQEGNQGIVFVKSSPSLPGHVSNVRYHQGRIEYLDVPGNTTQAAWLRNPSARVWFFPTTP